MSIDDSDIYHCYVDLWKCPTERINMAYQGIGQSNMLNTESVQVTPLRTLKTKPLLMPMKTGFTSHLTLNCWKLTCLFTKQGSVTDWNMS